MSSNESNGLLTTGRKKRGGRGKVWTEAMTSDGLLRDDLEVDRRHEEVDDEQQHERDDHGLVDGVTDTFGPTLRVEALVGGDHRGQRAEDERFELADPQVG